jgi:hypothetical protein
VAVGIHPKATVVAVAQAIYKDGANPRGISVVTGAIAQTFMMTLIEIFLAAVVP